MGPFTCRLVYSTQVFGRRQQLGLRENLRSKDEGKGSGTRGRKRRVCARRLQKLRKQACMASKESMDEDAGEPEGDGDEGENASLEEANEDWPEGRRRGRRSVHRKPRASPAQSLQSRQRPRRHRKPRPKQRLHRNPRPKQRLHRNPRPKQRLRRNPGPKQRLHRNPRPELRISKPIRLMLSGC